MSLQAQLNQPPDAQPAPSGEPGTVRELIEDLERGIQSPPPDTDVEIDDNPPDPDPDPDPDGGDDDADFPEGWDEDRIGRALAKMGYAALPADEIQKLVLAAAAAKETPPPNNEPPPPADDDSDDLAYAFMTDPSRARRMIVDAATREVAEQASYLSAMIQEIASDVPELEQADLELIRGKLAQSTLPALKEIRTKKQHIGAAKTFAYDKVKMKKPNGKKPEPPKSALRPDRTSMVPKPQDTAKSEQKSKFQEALSKRLGKPVELQ